jgi:phytoene desaturase
MPDYDVIVIGAGLGGLTTGALLAKGGRRVLVCEQSERIGGCCSTFERDGYRFDVGASIVEIKDPMEWAFKKLGTSLEKEVDLIPCDPVISAIFDDGHKVTYPLSAEKTGRVISSISPEDGRRWPDFVAYCSELLEVSLDTIFSEPADNLGDMLRMVSKNPRLMKYLPVFLSSYQDLLQRYFKNEEVLKTMTYQSLYFGLPSSLTPGPYAMLPYTEHAGVWYPRGGMISIPEAFQRVGERYGMQVKIKTPVKKVLIQGGRAAGVVLADGTEISSALVVSDVNAKMLYMDMIGEEYLPSAVASGLKSYKYSLACPMIYLGVDYEPPLAGHHSMIALSARELNDYWYDNVQTGILPEKSFGLICWPTHSDPSLAPKGKHVLNLIPEGFYRLKGNNWDAEKSHFLERVLDNFSKVALPGLEKHIEVMDCSTPLDFERHLNLPEGAIYAIQQDITAETVFRPSARSKSIPGLYLAGSSTNPGGGVPTVVASGWIAANLIDRYN